MLRFSWVPRRARQCENRQGLTAGRLRAGGVKDRGESHAISTIDRTRSQAWPFWLGLGLSLAIHIGLAAHLLSRDAQDFGATDITTTAISVNIEATGILDAAEQSAATDAAQAPASPPGEPAPAQEAEPEKAEGAPPRNEPEKAEAEPPSAAEQQAAEEAKSREEEARNAERKRRAETEKQAERQTKEKRARTAAGAGASGSRRAKASAGRVSASQGALQDYKGIVNAWMVRNKPPHGGGRGQVVVLIALSPSGALISARVVSSSGNQALDQRVLAAVRRASPFPKPPAGSTAAQRLFTFPYRFL